jgi:hypothetical protein
MKDDAIRTDSSTVANGDVAEQDGARPDHNIAAYNRHRSSLVTRSNGDVLSDQCPITYRRVRMNDNAQAPVAKSDTFAQSGGGGQIACEANAYKPSYELGKERHP